MWCDVAALHTFYASPLGRVARRMVGRAIRSTWPNVENMRLLGLGYPVPYLGRFRGEAERVAAGMPGPQGVVPWPADGAGQAVLIDETSLPFPDRMFDGVLVVHALECTESVRPLLREIWRVLADGGRLLVVVPNRRGIWAHFDRTPFGMGTPYSTSGLKSVLNEALFQPERSSTALCVPPMQSNLILRTAPFCETIGLRWFKTFAGIILVEATKQVYAGHLLFDEVAAGAVRSGVPRSIP